MGKLIQDNSKQNKTKLWIIQKKRNFCVILGSFSQKIWLCQFFSQLKKNCEQIERKAAKQTDIISWLSCFAHIHEAKKKKEKEKKNKSKKENIKRMIFFLICRYLFIYLVFSNIFSCVATTSSWMAIWKASFFLKPGVFFLL